MAARSEIMEPAFERVIADYKWKSPGRRQVDWITAEPAKARKASREHAEKPKESSAFAQFYLVHSVKQKKPPLIYSNL